MVNISVEAICFKSKTLKDGTFPIMLRLTQFGKRKHVSLGVSVNEQFWDFSKNKPKKNCPDKDLLIAVIDREVSLFRNQINQLKKEGKDCSLDALVQMVKKPVVRHTVGGYLDDYIDLLKAQERLGYAIIFEDLRQAMRHYSPSLDFPFSDITVSWLRGFELFMRKKGNKENTLGIRFRLLRTLYNRAIEDNLVKRDNYPFHQFKVSTFSEQTAKRALPKKAIQMISSLDLRTITTYHSPYLEIGRDLFLFSYYSCGINLVDMAKLKQKNLREGRISYIRQKTGKLISFPIQPPAMDIILKYRTDKWSEDDYLFPILDRHKHITQTQIHDRIKKANKGINRALRRIGLQLNLPLDLTTYVARHTFATVLKRSGVSTGVISESLGHSSEHITQIYLDSFENSQIDEAMKCLL